MSHLKQAERANSGLSGLGKTHPRGGEGSALLSLISSGNTVTDTPRNHVHQMSGHSVSQTS